MCSQSLDCEGEGLISKIPIQLGRRRLFCSHVLWWEAPALAQHQQAAWRETQQGRPDHRGTLKGAGGYLQWKTDEERKSMISFSSVIYSIRLWWLCNEITREVVACLVPWKAARLQPRRDWDWLRDAQADDAARAGSLCQGQPHEEVQKSQQWVPKTK